MDFIKEIIRINKTLIEYGENLTLLNKVCKQQQDEIKELHKIVKALQNANKN